ncbi:VirB10/TraB/TrbI family type IV secretion system protein [Enterobacter cloacae]|uniref:VirB10/TraB/TrbI family type IV secretion system protein n=1 Tax=Enterobacter cloacae TaxID=550 RepID=UPI002FF77118
MSEQDELKTAAELEAEARARAQAELAGDKKTQDDVPAGQPQVVKHAKRKSRRTLVVIIISLILVMLIATGGDALLAKLKGDRPEKAGDGEPHAAATSPAREREDLGRDPNALGALMAEDTNGETGDVHTDDTPSGTDSPAPATVVFDKTSALADSSPAAQASAAHRASSGSSSKPSADAKGQPGQTPAAARDDGLAKTTGVKRLNLDPSLYITADRHIPCAMMQRFVSDVGGRFTCQISEDVYSADNFVRLIPAGTIARGLYRTGTLKNGQGRLFLAITELRTPEPDRLVIPMMDSQAVGALGENGVAGWIDNHWMERIGNTVLLGTVQDFAAAAAHTAPGTDRNTDYTENTRAATAEMAKTVLENSINIPPTMYLNQGDVIGLVTGADIDFSGVYRLRMR